MVGPRLTLDPKSNGQDWLCGNGGKRKVKGALVFSSSNLVNAPAVPWGGDGGQNRPQLRASALDKCDEMMT